MKKGEIIETAWSVFLTHALQHGDTPCYACMIQTAIKTKDPAHRDEHFWKIGFCYALDCLEQAGVKMNQ